MNTTLPLHRMLVRFAFVTLLASVLAAPAAAQQRPQQPAPVPQQAAPYPQQSHPAVPPAVGEAAARDYQIGPDDLVEVAVWNNTAISRTVPVRPDGKITLPLLNDVQAAGLTPMQLRDEITKGLARYMTGPEVSIIVREVHSFRVSVLGQVKTPGRFEFSTGATVLDMLAMAGGLTEYADKGRIFILRRRGTATTRIPYAYDRVLSRVAATNSEEGFLVQPGDIIMVP
jgi:polysaccharide export outer membrane protein